MRRAGWDEDDVALGDRAIGTAFNRRRSTTARGRTIVPPTTSVPEPSTMWCSSAKPACAMAPAAFVRRTRLIRCWSSFDTVAVTMSGVFAPAFKTATSSASVSYVPAGACASARIDNTESPIAASKIALIAGEYSSAFGYTWPLPMSASEHLARRYRLDRTPGRRRHGTGACRVRHAAAARRGDQDAERGHRARRPRTRPFPARGARRAHSHFEEALRLADALPERLLQPTVRLWYGGFSFRRALT